MSLDQSFDEENSSSESEFGAVCRSIRTKLKTLTKTVESLTSAHFANVLTMTSEPMSQLIAFHLRTRHSQESHVLERLRTTVEAFKSHHQDIVHLCEIASYSCPQPDIYKDIRHNLTEFELITSQITSAIEKPRNKYDDDGDNDDDEYEIMMNRLKSDCTETLNELLALCGISLGTSQLFGYIENNIIK